MPFNDQIKVTSSFGETPEPPPDTARIWAMVAPDVPPEVTDVVTIYSTLAEMVDDGWDTGDAAFNAMGRLLEQTPTERAVTQVRMIKRETPVANVWTFDIVDTTDGAHVLNIDGVLAATFTASTSAAEAIKDGLLANLAVGAFSASHTGATVDVDTGSVTGNEAGIPFVLTGIDPTPAAIQTDQTIASVGIFEDLTAAYKESIFRNVLTPGASRAENDEGRRWVQADTATRRNFLFAESADAGIFDSGDTDNLAVEWLTAAYTRVNLLSHPNAVDYMASGAAGLLGGAFPGSRAWHKLDIAGSTEIIVTSQRTSGETLTMKDRRVSYTERMSGPASPMELIGSLDGNTPAGFFIAQKLAEDNWWYTIRQAVDGKMKSRAGVNIDEAGLQEMADIIKAAMQPMITAGVLAPAFTVTFTPIFDVPAGNLAKGDFASNAEFTVKAVITPKLRAVAVSAVFALFPSAVAA